jgi:hypothetical protein
VISIDEVNFVVKVKNSGQEQTLDFKNNGPKLPAGTPVAPPTPNAPAGMPGQPAFNPGAGTKPMAIPTAAPVPNFDRTVRTTTQGSPTGGGMAPSGMGMGPAAVGMPGLATAPSAGGSPQQQGVNYPNTQLDAEQQALAIEVMRAAQGGANSALPITRLTPREYLQNQTGNPNPNPNPLPGSK